MQPPIMLLIMYIEPVAKCTVIGKRLFELRIAEVAV